MKRKKHPTARLCYSLGGNVLWLLLTVFSSAAQSNPSITLNDIAKPALPRIYRDACPFEGCQFGSWRAQASIQLFSNWKHPRKLDQILRKGDLVTAITGVYLVAQPSQIRITMPVPEYGLVPGDIVLGYLYLGEGFYKAWSKGHWIEEFDGTGIVTPDRLGCKTRCNAKLLNPGRHYWWVKVKTKDGLIAWTKDSMSFDGNDAFAGSSYAPAP